MQVHLYTLSWNEADTLGFFFRHYDGWVDRYFVYDDGSTDGTIELLQAHAKVELRRFERTVPTSFVESHRRLQDSCWKASRGAADWVVITAVDEHLYVPSVPMREFLESRRREGVTYLPALGFQMISEEFPDPTERLCETRTLGMPFWQMNKLSVFDPVALDETNFAPGRHHASPRGRLRLPTRDELLLLHYKYLGFERTCQRQALLQTGLGDGDRRHRRGVQYGWTPARLRADWDVVAGKAVDIAGPHVQPWATHRVPRWWRAPLAHRAATMARKVRNRLIPG